MGIEFQRIEERKGIGGRDTDNIPVSNKELINVLRDAPITKNV